MNRTPTLETTRLRLFELSEEDAPFILELLNEPAFLRDIGDKGVRSLADARAYIENGPCASYRKYRFGLYRIELRASGESIGICGLLKREVLDDADLGYALLERYWRRGYAIEAAQAMMRRVREQLALRRVLAITALDNGTSIRLLEKLGFVFQGVVPLAGFDTPSKLFAWEIERGGATVQVSGET